MRPKQVRLLLQSQPPEENGILGNDTQQLARLPRSLDDIDAEDTYFSTGRHKLTGYLADQGGLTGAVRPQ